MAVSLSVGDVVYIKPSQTIGLVKYIGPMVDTDVMSDYVGIELLESVPTGHNGTIDGFTYFTTRTGYGFHTKIANVLKKVFASELFEQMQLLSNMLQKQSKRISKLELRLKSAIAKTTAVETPRFSVTSSNHSCVSRQSIPSRQSVPYSAISISSIRPTPTVGAASPASDSYEISYNIDAKPSNIQPTNNQMQKAHERRHSVSRSTSSVTNSSEKEHKNHHKCKKKSKERRKGKMKRRSVRQKSRSQSNMYDSLQSFQSQSCTPLKRNRANTHYVEGTGNTSVVIPSPSSPVSPFVHPQQYNLLALYYLAPIQSQTHVYSGEVDSNCNHPPHLAYSPHNYHYPNGTRFVNYQLQPQMYGCPVSPSGGQVVQYNGYPNVTSPVMIPTNQREAFQYSNIFWIDTTLSRFV
eukprot:443842_1